MTDTGDTEPGADLFDRWLAHRDGRSPEPAPEPPSATDLGVTAADEPARDVPDRSEPLPHTIFFRPRHSTQRVLGLILLACLAATVAAAVWMWSDRTYLSYGITGVAGVVTAIVWATRAGASPTRLTMHGSELEIVRNGSRALFDLASPHTPIELHGQPGERGWRVVIVRRSMSPYVIDAAMVDPVEFTRVLRYFRPEL